MKWEYKQATLEGPGIAAHLNALGAEGWELIVGEWRGAAKFSPEFWAVFKRPVESLPDTGELPAMEDIRAFRVHMEAVVAACIQIRDNWQESLQKINKAVAGSG